MSGRPTSRSPRRRGRSLCKVAARRPSKDGGQVSRPRASRQLQISTHLLDKRPNGPKVPGISPSIDPRSFGPTGIGDGMETTADYIDDFILGVPVPPPMDDDSDDPAEIEE